MTNRFRIPALLVALGLLLAGCGSDSKKDDSTTSSTPATTSTPTTTTQSTRDPEDKAAMEVAIGAYNRGYDRFLAALKRSSSLEAVKSAVYDYRTVLYKFDKAIRDIRFDDELVPEVNAILESNRHLISRLDYAGQAPSFHAIQRIYNRFLVARKPTVKAVNNLHDKL